MSKSDNAAEPSMEEILASIRKIISEEPIGSRPGPAPSPQPAHQGKSIWAGGGQGPLDPQQPRHANGFDALPIDDALDLGSGRPGAERPAGFAHGNGSESHGNGAAERGWSFAKPFAAAAGANGREPGTGAVSTTRPAAKLDAARPAAKPFFAPLDRDALRGEEAADLGAVVPGNAGEAGDAANGASDNDQVLAEAREKVERHLGKVSMDGDDRSVASTLKSIRDATVLGGNPAQKPAFESLVSRTAAAVAQAKAAKPDERQAVAAGSNGASAATNGAAVASTIKAGPQTKPREDAAEGASRPEAQNASAQAATGEPAVTRTFEDAVAEMLRPMLRQWLDANLPRMVQQVLREQMAGSPIPGKDPSGP